ncbi:MAG: enoyl-CoA hydratase/isomerase family protein [Sodalis sp. (in: enterobacteria)]|uniref:enoyl-CoA hydratase/isomerase family protein n=1 Tax=Sodalis sp. (in: enterobacteria) TaxID=1898979 RepID=UPI003F3C3082
MSSRFIRAGNRVFRRIREMDVPTLVVLSGHALGGGLELALACNFRYGAEGIKLGSLEATFGTIPGWMVRATAVRAGGRQTPYAHD